MYFADDPRQKALKTMKTYEERLLKLFTTTMGITPFKNGKMLGINGDSFEYFLFAFIIEEC